jgi:O-antigen/teichoic acid export membrane protein
VTLRRGFLSNLAGVGWTAAMQLAFSPLFLRRVGVEGYAFIGFFITLQAVLQVLDFGFAPTIGRWLARFAAGQEDRRDTRDLTRTLEIGSWVIGLAVGGVLAALVVPFGRSWFGHARVDASALRLTLILMAGTITAQWPAAFYQWGLLGLGKPASMNAVKAAASTLSAAGAAAVLLFVSPTVPAYFAVQIAVAIVQVAVLRWLLWRNLGGGERARFRPAALRTARRFAAEMTAVTMGAVLVAQIDRVILSRMLPLEQFGCYALGWVVAGGLAVVIAPAHNTLFPRLASLYAAGDEEELRRVYHRGARALSAMLLPLAIVVALFASPLLRAWTGNDAIARQTAPIAALLVIGMALNGLMHPAYALQLASGSTRLPLILTIGQLLFMVPAVTLLAFRYGAAGAAYAWPAMSVLYLAVGSTWTHRLFLPGAGGRWLLADVGAPLAGAVVPALIAYALVPLPASRFGTISVVAAVLACSFAASALAASIIRR